MKTTTKQFNVTLPVLDTAALKDAAQRAKTNVQRVLHVGPFSNSAKLEAMSQRLLAAEEALEDAKVLFDPKNYVEKDDYDFDDMVTARDMEREIEDAMENFQPDLTDLREFRDLSELVDEHEDKVDTLEKAVDKINGKLDTVLDPDAFDTGVAETEAVRLLHNENKALKAVLYRLVSVVALPDEVRSEAMKHLGDGNYPQA